MKYVALIAVALCSSLAHAQADYPAKPIRMVIGTPVGGGSELMGRYVGQQLTQAWGQPVVIDARPGASGNIAAEHVAKSPADGYTLYVPFGTHTVNPSLYSKSPYDPIKDFTMVTLIAKQYNALVVHPSIPAKSVKELLALAKAQPRKLSYGSSGNGSPNHLGMELLKQITGVDMVHVPYKGAAPSRIDLLGGHLELMFDVLRTALPFRDTGRIRMLAVGALQRQVIAPDVPTLDELGYKGMEVLTWHALLAPAGTPKVIADRLQTETRRGMTVPAFKEKLLRDGIDVITGTPAELETFLRADIEKWRKVIQTAKIRLD
ncbi:MAG TPA: tripartite tricarboxylate transporter substrate binding protein [Burkholderiales bacterium]|nr:tripartite tricarboxylate transporter substrate binding protein [Burkholderiales bacterium]